MDEQVVREQICDVCHKMWQLGWVAANDGNVSVRIDEDTIIATFQLEALMYCSTSTLRRDLIKLKKEVMQEFFGDSLVVNEGAELTWMRQPHYYMGLYPYTYSAGLTIGTAIANQIEENPEHAKVWLDTLSKGGSMSAKDLAIHAGCDVSTDKPLKQAIAYVGHLVDQLESLTAELKA